MASSLTGLPCCIIGFPGFPERTARADLHGAAGSGIVFFAPLAHHDSPLTMILADLEPASTVSSPDPLRVMFINTSLEVGGAETLLVNLVRRMDRGRFAPEVCCLKAKGELGELLAKEGKVHLGSCGRPVDRGRCGLDAGVGGRERARTGSVAALRAAGSTVWR